MDARAHVGLCEALHVEVGRALSGGASLAALGFAIAGVATDDAPAPDEEAPGRARVASAARGRVWARGEVGAATAPAFGEGDEIALVLNMDARRAAYYLNGALVAQDVFPGLPRGPLFPAAAVHGGSPYVVASFGLPYALLGRGARTLVHAPTPAFPCPSWPLDSAPAAGNPAELGGDARLSVL